MWRVFLCPIMDSFVVYILHSKRHQKIYIGCTANLIQGFYSHNSLSKKGYTKDLDPNIN
ncbi:MAG: GIY-YIG nuclease family protein [Flavobacteriaceae bacterium]